MKRNVVFAFLAVALLVTNVPAVSYAKGETVEYAENSTVVPIVEDEGYSESEENFFEDKQFQEIDDQEPAEKPKDQTDTDESKSESVISSPEKTE